MNTNIVRANDVPSLVVLPSTTTPTSQIGLNKQVESQSNINIHVEDLVDAIEFEDQLAYDQETQLVSMNREQKLLEAEIEQREDELHIERKTKDGD